jgi:hypothetical protein
VAIRKEELVDLSAPVVSFPRRAHSEPTAALGRRARMLARRRRAAAVLVGLVVGIGVLFGGGEGSSIAARPGAPRAVTMNAGDTLWDLAARHAAPSVDPRAFVDALVELNRLEGPPAPGTRVRLPR